MLGAFFVEGDDVRITPARGKVRQGPAGVEYSKEATTQILTTIFQELGGDAVRTRTGFGRETGARSVDVVHGEVVVKEASWWGAERKTINL